MGWDAEEWKRALFSGKTDNNLWRGQSKHRVPGTVPARKKAWAPGSLRISSMSRLNGQGFVSWANRSSCQMATADTVCFSRTADIRAWAPPEPAPRLTSFSMTFRTQHKHTCKALSSRQSRYRTASLGVASQWTYFWGVFQHPSPPSTWEMMMHEKGFHSSFGKPFLTSLQTLQLPYFSLCLRNGIAFYFSFSADFLAYHFSTWLWCLYRIYIKQKKIYIYMFIFSLLSHYAHPSSFSLTSFSPGTILFTCGIILSNTWLSVKISERFSWYRLNSSIP